MGSNLPAHMHAPEASLHLARCTGLLAGAEPRSCEELNHGDRTSRWVSEVHYPDCRCLDFLAPKNLLDLVDRYLSRGGASWSSTWRSLLLVVGLVLSVAVVGTLLYLLPPGSNALLIGLGGALSLRGSGALMRKVVGGHDKR